MPYLNTYRQGEIGSDPTKPPGFTVVQNDFTHRQLRELVV
jgi:hypothetical protein